MVSKTQKAKDAQEYVGYPQQCNTCKNFTSKLDVIPASGWSRGYKIEKNKRCSIGGFAIKSTASCKLYSALADKKGK